MQRLLLMLLGLVIGFVLASAVRSALLYWEERTAPEPPHPHVAFLIDATAVDPRRIDFTTLDGGAWRWLCLFGAGTEPLAAVRSELARRGEDFAVSPHLAALFADGASVLEPNEGALAVVDDGGLSIVRFAGLEAVSRMKEATCTDRSAPVVALSGR